VGATGINQLNEPNLMSLNFRGGRIFLIFVPVKISVEGLDK
jgi:hypothetical protein